MTQIRVVGEDALCCVLGERLVAQVLPGWSLAGESINTGGITKLVPALPRYMELARHVQPVLCVADTDNRCPVEMLREWHLSRVVDRFLLRLAVSEAECWILADREGAAEFFDVALKHVPAYPEQAPDAKRTVLRLATLSKVRPLRQEMVSSADINKPGSGYNLHLRRLVTGYWSFARAAPRSNSLSRAVARLRELAAGQSRSA